MIDELIMCRLSGIEHYLYGLFKLPKSFLTLDFMVRFKKNKDKRKMENVHKATIQIEEDLHRNAVSGQIKTRYRKSLFFEILVLTILAFITSYTLIMISSIKNQVTIALIATNDIHGHAFPVYLPRHDRNESYKYGGLVYMARLIQIIQNQYPNRSIYLDAGDQFSGGLQSSSIISSGEIVNDFFQNIGLRASAIGNHQFDFGPDFLFPLIQRRKSINLAANLFTKNYAKIPKKYQSTIFQFQYGIKVGVIGLATTETPQTTGGFSSAKFPDYQFAQYRDIVIEQSNKLKQKGVDAVIVLAHVGNKCNQSFDYGIWTKQSRQQECPDDQITNLIDSMPKGTIDGIIQGHRHKIVHQFYKDIPFMGSIKGGYYFNAMYLTFSKDYRLNLKVHQQQKLTQSRLKDIKIEGPIPVCQKVFQGIGRCSDLKQNQIKKAGQLINWKFHGQPVYAHSVIDSLFKLKWLPKMQPFLTKITQIDQPLAINPDKQNALGDLITNVIHSIADSADFVILNQGTLRAHWRKGIIDYQDIYGMMPFDTELVTFKIYGKQLKKMLKIVQEGQKGFYQTWNLKQTIKISYDKNGNQIKEYICGQFYNGTQIDDKIQYTGATIDFLLAGGDDFEDVIGQVYQPRSVLALGGLRALIRAQLAKKSKIQTKTLVDPNHPRLILLSQNPTVIKCKQQLKESKQ